MDDIEKVMKDLGTAVMCVNNLLTQEQFIVRDQVVNAMIQAINTIKEQRQQIIVMTEHDKGNVLDWLNEIIDNPEEWQQFYSDSEVKLLAEKAKGLIA